MPSVQLRPKELFQNQSDLRKDFGNMAHGNVLQSAVTHALAEFARNNPTADEMRGANAFVSVLLNLSDNPDPMPHFPVKRLQQPQNQRTE
jgi:hypothetical protein